MNTEHPNLGDGGELLVETTEVNEFFEGKEKGARILQQNQPPRFLM